MEIGLGCDMTYGPKKSLDLWDRYFTHKDARIFFIEYDSICAEKLQHSRPRVSVDGGDQGNTTFLNSFIEKHGGNFDIIVDDGGHRMGQQITSLVTLFPALISGGLYFIEDMQTSYLAQYGGGYLKEQTTIEYIKRMIDAFYGQGTATEIIKLVRSIHCFHQLCLFIKKSGPDYVAEHITHFANEEKKKSVKADFDLETVTNNATDYSIHGENGELLKNDFVKTKADYFKNFREIALESGTSKVITPFIFAYDQYLPDLRHSPVRFVEIGLGCDMTYGPGKSLDLWDRYFTHKDARIFFIEYNSVCAEKLQHSRPRVSVDGGDQGNTTFLNSFIEKHGGNFDIIVDDRGRRMEQVITSLVTLFPALISGGLYFIEDMHTSYMEHYGGGYLKEQTTIEYIKRMIDAFYGQGTATEIIELVRSIHCFHQLCLLIKKK